MAWLAVYAVRIPPIVPDTGNRIGRTAFSLRIRTAQAKIRGHRPYTWPNIWDHSIREHRACRGLGPVGRIPLQQREQTYYNEYSA